MGMFKYLIIGKSLERALGYSVGYVGAVIMFIIASNTTGLTVPLIFSVAEMATLLKSTVLFIVLGMGVYYDLTVIFDRFSLIFNMEDISMIKEDLDTDDPPTFTNIENNDADSLCQLDVPSMKSRKDCLSGDAVKKGSIRFTNFNGFWSKDSDEPTLKDINYYF
jgi:hypothetical protein